MTNMTDHVINALQQELTLSFRRNNHMILPPRWATNTIEFMEFVKDAENRIFIDELMSASARRGYSNIDARFCVESYREIIKGYITGEIRD